jgi:hypothetical protein
MRPATLLPLLFVLGILSPLTGGGSAGAAAREWVVSGPENLADQTIFLEENLTIAVGGRLALDNVTLRFNSTETSTLVLEVLAGGELVLRNSTVASNGSGPYLVRALPGSKITISGCTVSHAGTCATVPDNAGVLVATNQSSISNSTFRDGAAGLYLLNGSPGLPGCQFMGNDIGAVLDGSDAEMQRCRFANEGGLDMRLLNGSRAQALDTDIDPSLVEVLDAGSLLDIQWSLTVAVGWDDGRPAAGALVRVNSSDGSGLLYTANASGLVPGIPLRTATLSATGLQGHGPFNVSAESEGRTAWNVTDINSDWEVLLTLDGTPPQITIDYPADGAMLNGTPLPASGSVWDPNPLQDRPSEVLVEARIDAGAWTSANGTGSWSFGLAGLPEGLHTLTVRARDPSGNSNQSSVRFETDLSAPSLEVWPPPGHLSAAPNITVSIVTDGDTVLFNGSPVGGHLPGRLLQVDWALELEGDNTAIVISRDAAGNSALKELLVVRDTTPPAVNFSSPPAFSVVNTSLVTVTGRSSDLHGIVLVEWGPDRENWTRVNGTAEWSFPVILYEGQNTVYVRATDAAGNAGTGWLRLDLRLPDTMPPEVRILYPESGQEVASAVMDVTVRASDAGGIRAVQLSLDGNNWTNATGAGDWTGRLTLLPGPNSIRARAYDLSGNVNTTLVTVAYSPPPPDRTPPVLTVLYPPSGLKVAYSKIVVSGRASDSSGVSSVEISADGKSWTRCILTGDDWSGTVTLSAGRNTISVRAADSLGNQAQSSTGAVYDQPADPAAGRTTLSLILVLVMLALFAAWLMVRAPTGRGRRGRPPGPEEE